MRRNPILVVLAGILAWGCGAQSSVASGAEDPAEAETFFEAKIRPVLAASCYKCHGAEKASSDLRVDSRAALLKGGEAGTAIVPGNPEASRLIQAIRYASDDLQMPPKKRLPDRV